MNPSTQIDTQPDSPWLDLEDPGRIESLMRRLGWLELGETIERCARAGEGNMNLTLRIDTNRRSVVLKQSRPWVEKYDHIAAPVDRIAFEHRFYQRIADIPEVARSMAAVLGFDAATHVMLLEHLPEARDFTDMYRGAPMSDADLRDLAGFARALHDATQGRPDPAFANRAMRALNHEHLYRLPLVPDNGLHLDRFEPGLDAASQALKEDARYVAMVHETGRRYLADGGCLLHGDYFPGSWLRTPRGPRVIDPEFCFYGDREFDVGCATAHLTLARRGGMIRKFIEAYGGDALDHGLVARYAAAEVMRRLIGVAQLPLGDSQPSGTAGPTHGARGTRFRAGLLDRSRQAMLAESLESLMLCE